MLREEPEQLRKMADKFIKMGAKGVGIKCGIKGFYYRGGKDENLAWNNAEVFVNTFKEINSVVDTVGAGDNAIAGWMFFENLGYNPIDCARAAVAAGTLNAQHRGSIGAFRNGGEILSTMKLPVINYHPGRAFRMVKPGIYVGKAHGLAA